MNIKKIVLIILVLCWAGIVFMFSAETSDESNKRSDPLADILVETNTNYLAKDNSKTNLNIVEELKSKLTTENLRDICVNVVRKTAHFVLYLTGGVLVYLLVDCYDKDKRVKLYIAQIACSIYAATDELHQYFVPGRYASILDVALDSAGAFVGILIIRQILKHIEAKKKI